LGAFVFGSVARGEAMDRSDLDVKVIVNTDGCQSINHPFIDGIKLDISFISFEQLVDSTARQAKKHERIPMIAEAIIIFDKTGKLKALQKQYQKIKPKKYGHGDHQNIKFMAFHANEKIEKNLTRDPALAMLAMHLGLNDLIKMHYQIHGYWYLGAKRILADLYTWDKLFSGLLRSYVREANIQKKFQLWSKMLDYVLKPISGRQDIKDNNCSCTDCKKDLAALVT
jgi:hypothetical protein